MVRVSALIKRSPSEKQGDHSGKIIQCNITGTTKVSPQHKQKWNRGKKSGKQSIAQWEKMKTKTRDTHGKEQPRAERQPRTCDLYWRGTSTVEAGIRPGDGSDPGGRCIRPRPDNISSDVCSLSLSFRSGRVDRTRTVSVDDGSGRQVLHGAEGTSPGTARNSRPNFRSVLPVGQPIEQVELLSRWPQSVGGSGTERSPRVRSGITSPLLYLLLGNEVDLCDAICLMSLFVAMSLTHLSRDS